MFTDLQEYLKRPALFERTEEKFWNYPHISAQMLQYHLNPNTDAASRKPEFIKCCAEWISSLPLPEGASLLDIGCGPGLYTKQFAERGLRVTGLDFSESSIKHARTYDPKSEYIMQDYLEMNFSNAFDVITLIYCDYPALIPEERNELLRRVYRALKPNGLFVFDVFTSLSHAGRRENKSWAMYPNGGFWSAKPHICLGAGYFYGETVAVDRTVVIEDQAVRCYNIWDACFNKESLLAEVSPAGFSELGFYSDATGTPYSDESPTICAVLIKV